MNIVKRRLTQLMMLAILASVSSAATLAAQTTIVRPSEIDDILINPGMGVETFQRFGKQAVNEGLRWSEVGPETATPDSSSVDFPDSSVAYLRWFWSQIEPQRGSYRWSIIDDALAEAHRHGQQLAIRIMPYDDKHAMPALVSDVGSQAGQCGDGQGRRDLVARCRRSALREILDRVGR